VRLPYAQRTIEPYWSLVLTSGIAACPFFIPAGSSSEDARSRELTHSAGNIHSFRRRPAMDVFFIHILKIGFGNVGEQFRSRASSHARCDVASQNVYRESVCALPYQIVFVLRKNPKINLTNPFPDIDSVPFTGIHFHSSAAKLSDVPGFHQAVFNKV
jgi:hypothetical protein